MSIIAYEKIRTILLDFCVRNQAEFSSHLYIPSDFSNSELEEFIVFARGGMKAKESYGGLLEFWIYGLFDFVESQMQDEKFERYAKNALCETIISTELYQQVSYCFSQLKPPLAPKLMLDGDIITIYKMFDDEKRVSYAIETSQTYYAFFWEQETGTQCG